LADGGLLVLLDVAALPISIQQLIARAHAERNAPWESAKPLDVQLAVTGTLEPRALVKSGRLDSSLALRLADAKDAPVLLPRLRDRAEDLRAILTDRLAREGLRVHGRAVGIEQAAYARLIEHDFPGEDAELSAIVQRLVASCSGDVVRVTDVRALHLHASSGEAAVAWPEVERKSPASA
jgi:DNA-binding NtrC family response regulator